MKCKCLNLFLVSGQELLSNKAVATGFNVEVVF